jgi:hypothetical protein
MSFAYKCCSKVKSRDAMKIRLFEDAENGHEDLADASLHTCSEVNSMVSCTNEERSSNLQSS